MSKEDIRKEQESFGNEVPNDYTYEIKLGTEVILTAELSQDGKGFNYKMKQSDVMAVMGLYQVLQELVG